MTVVEELQDWAVVGEDPGIEAEHVAGWMRALLGKARAARKGLAEGEALHLQIATQLPGNGKKPIYHGPIEDVFIGRPADEEGEPSGNSVLIRLKDTAENQSENHALRKELILPLAAIAVGTSVYVIKKTISKHK